MPVVCPVTIRLALLASAIFLSVPPSKPSEVRDYPIVLNGDTLVINTVSIKLDGIDALHLGQKCIAANSIEWDCGNRAKLALEEKVGKGPIVCRQLRVDTHGRPYATCATSNGEDLAAAMVRSGYALACGYRYIEDEKAARVAGNGMWSGSFQTPWEWRAQQPDPAETRICDDIDCFDLSEGATCR